MYISHRFSKNLLLHAEAEKARDSLNGRFFGGRMVKSDIYDQALYDHNDLSGWNVFFFVGFIHFYLIRSTCFPSFPSSFVSSMPFAPIPPNSPLDPPEIDLFTVQTLKRAGEEDRAWMLLSNLLTTRIAYWMKLLAIITFLSMAVSSAWKIDVR